MNVFKISVALSMIFIAVSCNKEIDINYPEIGNDITIRSGVETKAGYTSQSLPTEFVIDIIQGKTGYDYANVKLTKAAEGNTYYPSMLSGGNISLKWANSNHSGTEVKAMTIPAGVATTLEDHLVKIEIMTDQTNEDNFKKNDILGAKTSDGSVTINGDDIELSFRHLMSKLHVVYETVDKTQTVEYIKLKNVCTEGNYSYKEMKGGQPASTRGDINMFLNPSVTYGVKAAEAIFYPYNPTSLQIEVKLSGQSSKTYNVTVPNGFSFAEGKRYLLNIKISSNGSISANGNVSSDYNWVKNVPGGKILWIGTSIPAGSSTNNYPKMISNATGLEIVNNSVAATKVLRIPEPLSGGYDTFGWVTMADWDYKKAGGLSQTKQEANETYRNRLMEISGNNTTWVDEQILAVQSLSYESLIIPYIDGTLDDCQTIVIDHGFNDLWGVDGFFGMLWEAGYYFAQGAADGDIYGSAILLGLDNETYNSTYVPIVTNTHGLSEEGSYLMCMERIINAIYEVNPNAKIIIGNYFAPDSPWVRQAMSANGLYLYDYNLTGTLLLYNQAVAKIWDLDIVNVYNSIGEIGEWYTFCPVDGVHPSNDETGNSNRRIADVYLDEFGRIFGGTNTRAISNTELPGWEDEEIL